MRLQYPCFTKPHRSLRDYKNTITPKAGFSSDIIKEIIRIAEPLTGVCCHERFVISFGEIKIQQNLVYNKHTVSLFGFVDLRDQELDELLLARLISFLLVYYI